MKKVLIYVIAISVLGISCNPEKDIDSNYAEDYRFFLKGQVNGLPFEYNAGEDGYFLETNYYREDSVVVMEGTLAKFGEADKNAVVIRIRSKAAEIPGSTFLANENIEPRDYAFRDVTGYRAQTGKFMLSLFGDSSFLANTNHFYWIVNGIADTSGYELQKTFDRNTPNFNVALRTTISGNCESEVRHFINLQEDCDATFKMYVTAADRVMVKTIARVGSISDVQWFLDSTLVTPNFLGEIDLSLVPNASMLTCSIYFDDGCVRRIDRSLNSTLQSPCITDFWYQKQKPTIHDPNQYSTVELEYYDANGKMYTSHYTDVVGDFTITSASPFQLNANGDRTMRFFMEADVILKNVDGSTVELKNGFGSFAVAHP